MKIRWCHLLFLVFAAACDAKSVSCDGSSSCENSLIKDLEKNEQHLNSKKKDTLEELKENIGTVGNKLEGIVYEVLKDILKDDIDLSDESNHTDKLQNSTIPNLPSNKTEVTEEELSNSNRLKEHFKNKTTDMNEIKHETERPSRPNHELPSSTVLATESSIQLETTNGFTPTSTTMKSRRRRMVQNTEQSRSVESFLDSNQEKGMSFREDSTNQLEDPAFVANIPMPDNVPRLRSKGEELRKEPKREPTENNKSKRPQDEVSMRYMPLHGDMHFESSRPAPKKSAENNASDTPKRRKSSPQVQQMNKATHASSNTDGYQYQKNPDGKNGYRINDRNMDQLQHPSMRKSEQLSIEDPSDVQLPLHKHIKKIIQQSEDTQRSNANLENLSRIQQVNKFNDESKKQLNSHAISNKVEAGDSTLGQSYMWGNQASNCYEKNSRDDILEKQHIEDLKYEVNKLRNVVDLLKEQQRLINSFDGDKKTMNTQEMMNVLNQLNSNNEKPVALDKTTQYAVDTTTKAKHEELGQIKVQLKEAIDNLNRTKEILNLEHKKEVTLETELRSQKSEINWLKLIIENFIIAQAKKKLKEEPSEPKIVEPEIKTMNDTSLVGAQNPLLAQKKPHNRTIPSTVKMAQEKLMEMEQMRNRERSVDDARDREMRNRMKDVKVSSPKARASMSTLEKLLDNLSDKQSKTLDDDDNFQNRLLDAIKQARRKKEEESFTKDILRKLQLNSVESKSDDDMLVKFQKALKSLDTPQGKNDDLDIEDQLKVLQKEINKLKPTDDLSLFTGELKAPEDDNTQLQLMLTKLIANNPQLQGMKLPPITAQQLMQLQKKFGKRPGFLPPVMANVGVGGDFGVTPPASLMNTYPSGFGKVGPLYGPFGPGLSSYGSAGYGKGIDTAASLASYPSGYGLGQDLSKMLYGSSASSSYSPSTGFPSSNDYSGNLGYFGNSGLSGNNGFLGSYGSNPGTGTSYSAHGSNYPSPSLGVYGVSKTPYGGGMMSGYGNIYSSPNIPPYGKPQDGGYAMNPYGSQPLTYSNPTYGANIDMFNNDKKNYGNNNFFQVSQPGSYGSGPPAPYLPPKAIDAPGPDKVYGNQPPYAASNTPYASDKIEELKTQIYSLQNAISTYNRPEYTQTAEDKNTIHNLEQQIEELKGIVNSLNGYSGEQQNYSQAATNQYEPLPYSAAGDQKSAETYNSEKRAKRSIEDQIVNKVNNSTTANDPEEEHDGFIHKITSFLENAFGVSHNKTRRRRSVDDNSIDDSSSSNVMDKITSVLREVLDDEPDSQGKPTFGSLPSPLNQMNGLPRSAEDQKNMFPKQTSLQDIKKQIDHLKRQLGSPKSSNEPTDKLRTAEQNSHSSARHALLPEPSYGFNYALNPFSTDLTVKSKKLDIFQEIVAKIMDKVIASLPIILQKLFGFAIHELTAYGDDYGTAYGTDSSYLTVFRNLGIFGYLPLILLRIVNAISTFIYILQKNKFLKYFLVPAGVVLLVTGGMVFLIWWLQPGDFYINYDKLSYDKEPQYGADYYSGDYAKSNGQIVKSYGVEDSKSRVHSYNHAVDTKTIQPNAYPSFYKPNLVISPDNQLPVYNNE